MLLEFYCYPKCSTCRNAKKWLDKNNVEYRDLNIVEKTPTAEQLTKIIKISELPIKRFFNTSGIKYREMQLKDKLPAMTEEEQIQILASDGMLIKRPLAFDGNHVTLGFKIEEYEQVWK